MNKTISRFLLFGLVLPLPAAITEPVRVEQGMLSGVAGAGSVATFRPRPTRGTMPASDCNLEQPSDEMELAHNPTDAYPSDLPVLRNKSARCRTNELPTNA